MEVLTHPMLDQLAQLGLTGMVQAFAELEASGDGVTLTHADWLGLLVDREMPHPRNKPLAARLRYARLRHHAVVEDIDYRAPRGLDRGLFNKLVNGEWIDAHDNLILCGPTGVEKLACLCSRPQSLPRQSLGALSARPQAVCRPRPGPRRWALRPHHAQPQRRPAPHPRRLGSRS